MLGSSRRPRTILGGIGHSRLYWLAVLAIGTYGFLPGLARAQEPEFQSPAAARLQVTSASEEANTHFWAGLDDLENIFFARSASRFKQALALDPNFGLARVAHASFAPGLSNDEKEAEFKRGFAALAESSSGELLVAMAWREWDSGNLKAAKKLMRTASQLMPGDPHIAFQAAWLKGTAGEQSEGISALRSVTERFPEHAPTYNILAYWLWQTGDHEGGLRAVKGYVARAPDHPNPHDSYAELLQWDGRYEEAIKHYRRAIELDESYQVAYIGLAEVYQLMGEGEQAREFLSQAIERATDTQTRLQRTRALGNSYLMDGKRKAAMEQFATVATEAEANDIDWLARAVHHQMAITDAILGNGRSIESHLMKAAELGGEDNPGQYATTALAYGIAGQIGPAREAARKVEEAAAQNESFQSVSHRLNGLLYLQENELAMAIDELSQAEAAEDNMVRALLAECYKKMGRSADARALRDDVLNDRQLNFLNVPHAIARLWAKRL